MFKIFEDLWEYQLLFMTSFFDFLYWSKEDQLHLILISELAMDVD